MMDRSKGFTLIEVLVALAISAVLITGVYTVLRQGMGQLGIIEGHDQELHSLFLIRRVIDRDLQSLVALKDPESDKKYRFRIGIDGVVLNCRGSVVADSRLGPLVEVHYRWNSGSDALLERRVVGLGGDVELSDEVLYLGQGVQSGSVEIHDGEEWSTAEMVDETKMYGVRFQLDFSQIGVWKLIYPVKPLPSDQKKSS